MAHLQLHHKHSIEGTGRAALHDQGDVRAGATQQLGRMGVMHCVEQAGPF